MTVIVQNRTTLEAPPEPLPPTSTFVKRVNGKTGVVVLDATDVGALSAIGKEVIELASSTFAPAYNVIYTYTLTGNTTIAFNVQEDLTRAIEFELHIRQGNTAYNVTWPNGLKWSDSAGKYSVNNPVPAINTANTLFNFTVRIINGRILINLAYSEEL